MPSIKNRSDDYCGFLRLTDEQKLTSVPSGKFRWKIAELVHLILLPASVVAKNVRLQPGTITSGQTQSIIIVLRNESTAPDATGQDADLAPLPIPEPAGPLADFANNLSKGTELSFNALYLGEDFTNSGEGLVPNQQAIGSEFRPGVDIDLNRLFGWSGVQIHISESIFFLQSNLGPAPVFPADGGGLFSTQAPYGQNNRAAQKDSQKNPSTT
jgi:carbohydrate-selective porin OprB